MVGGREPSGDHGEANNFSQVGARVRCGGAEGGAERGEAMVEMKFHPRFPRGKKTDEMKYFEERCRTWEDFLL